MRAEIYWPEKSHTDMIAITHATQSALLADIGRKLKHQQGFTLATLNLDHCVKIGRFPEFLAAYKGHSHVVADGNPIVWLSRLAGRNVSLVPGSELVAPLADLAVQYDVPVALFGATPETLAVTAKTLAETHAALRIVARIAPTFGFDPQQSEADDLIAQLAESGARMCFLALGAPKQEVFAMRAAAAMPSCGFVSIGAGLDFIAGSQKRAPDLIRKLSLEWFWRLTQSPRRMTARYAACFAILPQLALQARHQRRQR